MTTEDVRADGRQAAGKGDILAQRRDGDPDLNPNPPNLQEIEARAQALSQDRKEGG